MVVTPDLLNQVGEDRADRRAVPAKADMAKVRKAMEDSLEFLARVNMDSLRSSLGGKDKVDTEVTAAAADRAKTTARRSTVDRTASLTTALNAANRKALVRASMDKIAVVSRMALPLAGALGTLERKGSTAVPRLRMEDKTTTKVCLVSTETRTHPARARKTTAAVGKVFMAARDPILSKATTETQKVACVI